MRRAVFILFAVLVLPRLGRAQTSGPSDEGARKEWIQPEEVPVRAFELQRELEADQPTRATKETVERIERGLSRLAPRLGLELDQATRAIAESISFLELEDVRDQLALSAAPLAEWEDSLAAEASRTAKALAQIAQAQQRWHATSDRPEMAQAETLVSRNVHRSITDLDETATSLKAWSARVLTLSSRVSDLRVSVGSMMDTLDQAQASDRDNLFVRAPIWQGDLTGRLASELPRVSELVMGLAAGTMQYIEQNPSPLGSKW
jgi:hypothetical protein